MKEPIVIPFVPREPERNVPRCPTCWGIVQTTWEGLPLPPGVGYCPRHNVVRYVRRGDD